MIAEDERLKYRRMWAEPIYREESPGERAIDKFLLFCNWHKGDTLVDVGAGTGRAGKALRRHGLTVTLLDCCPEANETDLPCLDYMLWDTHVPGVWDWLYCVDVLEHIPTECVEKTLDNLAAMAVQGGYLQIALFEDGCGKLIGERLHLTVQPADWWYGRIRERWQEVDSIGHSSTYARFIVGRPR